MRWLSLASLVDQKQPSILQSLLDNPGFVENRDEHYHFGIDRFMNLEQLKKNFPPLYEDEYTEKDAKHFAWGTAMEYLGRHFPQFLKSHRSYIKKHTHHSLNSLLSLYTRSIFIFYKYYLHRQSPGESDFLDFAQISYAPYCDVFVTERNVYNVLNHIKKSEGILRNTEILHITDFLQEIDIP